jgi:hypothetical protein
MRTLKNGMVRRSVTLTQELTTIITSRTEATGREFSAELRYLLAAGLIASEAVETPLRLSEGPRVSA